MAAPIYPHMLSQQNLCQFVPGLSAQGKQLLKKLGEKIYTS